MTVAKMRTMLLVSLLAQLCCSPAWASDGSEAKMPDPPSSAAVGMQDEELHRWLAASLSAGLPFLMYAGARLIPPSGEKLPNPMISLMPLTSGSGQVYAGHVVRGVLIGLGGLVLFGATQSFAVRTNTFTSDPSSPDASERAQLVSLSLLAAYSLLSGWDAYETAKQP
ncbi:MAG: hypothetical protein JWM80_3481 [Cyanobacteria bacterium RYN_339]|nr:hypothetical protein [Cyanobacteria bacterium RYN_339]